MKLPLPPMYDTPSSRKDVQNCASVVSSFMSSPTAGGTRVRDPSLLSSGSLEDIIKLRDPRTTLRVKIINEQSQRQKDMVLDLHQDDQNLFDAVYNHQAVKAAHIRKWNSTVAQQVREKKVEIRCAVWDDAINQPFHSFNIDQLKQLTIQQLHGLVPESDPIKMVLQCVHVGASIPDALPLTTMIKQQSPTEQKGEKDCSMGGIEGCSSLSSHQKPKAPMTPPAACPFSGVPIDPAMWKSFQEKMKNSSSAPHGDGDKKGDTPQEQRLSKGEPGEAQSRPPLAASSPSEGADCPNQKMSPPRTMGLASQTASQLKKNETSCTVGLPGVMDDSCRLTGSQETLPLATFYDKASMSFTQILRGSPRRLLPWEGSSHGTSNVSSASATLQSSKEFGSSNCEKGSSIESLSSVRSSLMRSTGAVDLSGRYDSLSGVSRCSEKTTMRVRVTNPSSGRFKDLLVDIRDDVTVYESIYNSKAVFQANVRKWGRDIVRAVRSKQSEVQCAVWDAQNHKPWRVLSVSEMKKTSTKDLLDIVPEWTDLVELHLQVVPRKGRDVFHASLCLKNGRPASTLDLSKLVVKSSSPFTPTKQAALGNHMAMSSGSTMSRSLDPAKRRTLTSSMSCSANIDRIMSPSSQMKGASSNGNAVWSTSSQEKPAMSASVLLGKVDRFLKGKKSPSSKNRSSSERGLKRMSSSQSVDHLSALACSKPTQKNLPLRPAQKQPPSKTRSFQEPLPMNSIPSPDRFDLQKAMRKAQLMKAVREKTECLKKFKKNLQTRRCSDPCQVAITDVQQQQTQPPFPAFPTLEENSPLPYIPKKEPDQFSPMKPRKQSAVRRRHSCIASSFAPSSPVPKQISRFLAVEEYEESQDMFIPLHILSPQEQNKKGRNAESPPVKEISVVEGTTVDTSGTGSISLQPAVLKQMFPYHIVLDEGFCIRQIGDSLPRLLEDNALMGRPVDDVLKVIGPIPLRTRWDWNILEKMKDTTIYLESQASTKLKCTTIELSESPKLVMLAITPNVKNLVELEEMGMSMVDLPLHSCQRESVLLGEHNRSEVQLTNHLDILHRELINSMEQQIKDRTNELASANEDLERANAQISGQSARQLEHFACMSHEIRTPLNCIVGMSSLLLDDAEEMDPMHADSIKMINTSGDLLKAVVDDVLDYAKLESGSFEVDIKPTNLQLTIDSVVHSISQKVAEKNVRLRTHFSPLVPCMVETDYRRLQQILFNLLGNAGKFSKKDSVIDLMVSIRPAPREEHDVAGGGSEPVIRFAVIDYGKGIEKKDYKSIFEPFSQASKETQTIYGGTGLGLSITAKLVKRLGGTISLDSEYGKYTNFTVDIPFVGAPTDQAGLKYRLQHTTLVVVDVPTNYDYSFTSYSLPEEPTAFNSQVSAMYGLNVIRCKEMEQVYSALMGCGEIGSGKHYAILVHESLYEVGVFELLEGLVGQLGYTLMTFGPQYQIELTKERHFKSLTGVFPAALLDSISNIVGKQKKIKMESAHELALLKSRSKAQRRDSMCKRSGTSIRIPSTVSTADNDNMARWNASQPIHHGDSHAPGVRTLPETGLDSAPSPSPAANKATPDEVDRATSMDIQSSLKSFQSKKSRSALKVLYAEDNLINQKVLNRVLNRAGIVDVTIVGNGKKAVDLTATTTFDIIFMDLQMPVMGGMEACELIVERDGPDTTVVFVTAHALEEFKSQADAAGAKSFISKPFRLSDIETLLDELLAV